MRIAVDGRPLRHPRTGIGVYAFELLSRFAEEHALFVYFDRPLDRRLGFRAAIRAGRVHRTGLLDGLARHATTHFLFPRWARADRADVFWGPRHNLPLGLRGVPGVVTIHDMVWRRAPDTMRPLNRAADALLMPMALRQAAGVLAVSADTANEVRRFCGRDDVRAVPNAARALPAAEPFDHPRPYFLWIGQREPRKNLPGIVEGFRLAGARGLDSHDLVLVGPPGWGRSASGAAPGVIDLGAVSDARLAGLLRGCAALAMASFYEGFGIPLLEAMRHGKPVIASAVGALMEVAGDAALFVDPEAPASIAAAFLRVAKDGALYRRLAERAQLRAAAFSWDRAARETLATLRAAAARPPV